MKDRKNSKTMEMLIRICLEIQKQLQLTRNIEGTFQLVFYFIVNLITATQTHNLTSWFRNNSHTYSVLLCLILTIKPLTLFITVIVYLWQKNEESKQNPTKVYLLSQFKTLFIFLLRKKEFITFPVKYLIYLCFFLDPELRKKILTSALYVTLLMAWMIIDVMSSALLTQIKVSYLRSFTPEIDYFTKLDGYFEQILLKFMLFGTSISALGLAKFQDQSGTLMALTIFALLSFLIVGYFYFKELPYLHRMTEKVMGLLLINFIGLFFFYSILNNYQFLRGLITYSIFSPVVILLCLRVINQQYNSDYLKKDKIGKFKYIKKIYVNNHNYSSYKEVIEDYGIVKKHLISSKSEKRYLEVWKLMANIKTIENIKNIERKHKFSSGALSQNFENYSINGAKMNFEIESTNLKYQLIFHKMDSLVFDEYIKETKDNPFMILLKIVWIMRNDIRLNSVFSCLRLMKLKSKTFKERFYFEYAKTEISHVLKGIYFQEELYFDNIELSEKKKKLKIKPELNKISKIGIDLCYGLYYKDKIKKICELVTTFISKNKKFLEIVNNDTKKLKSAHQTIKQLYVMDKKIILEFQKLHVYSHHLHFWHFAIYFYYLLKGTNMHKSATKIFREYKRKCISKTKAIIKNESIFSFENFFDKMIIFLIESEKGKFGKILDTFGDTKKLRSTHQSLKGKHMDSLIMDSHIRAHTRVCENFMNQPLNRLMNNVRKTFIKLPSTDYFLPVSFRRKIVPFVHKNFNFIIGTKFLKLESKMHIMLDEYGKIDCFSDNMKYLFRNPDEYLVKKKMKLSDICPKLWEKMKNNKNLTSKLDLESHISENEFSALTKKSEMSHHEEDPGVKDKLIYKSMNESDSLVFKFRNFKTGKIASKKFKVEIREKHYKSEFFCYYLLSLIHDDNEEAREWSIKPLTFTKSNFMKAIERRSRDTEIHQKLERSLKKFDGETSERVKTSAMNKSSFKFMKDVKNKKNDSTHPHEEEEQKNLIQINEVNSIFFDNDVEVEDLKMSEESEKNISCGGNSIHSLTNQEIKINTPDIEEQIFPLNNKTDKNKKFVAKSFHSLIYSEKGDESEMKTEEVFKESSFKSQKKYYSFETIAEKNPKKITITMLKAFFLISSFSLVCFSYYITYILQEQNEESSFDTKTIKEIIKLENNLLLFNNWLLRQTAISEGFIHQDR